MKLETEQKPCRAVVFDVGNVLLNWSPDFLYRRLIVEDDERRWFLQTVCTMAWNVEQDRGRSWAEAVDERIALFPQYADLIRAYDTHWHDMVPDDISENVQLLKDLHEAGIPLYCITNFSSEKFVEVKERFPYLTLFDGTIVSAEEALLKPDPAIYRLLESRYGLDLQEAIFIDDSAANISGAETVGLQTAHFTGDCAALRETLRTRGFPV